jgi:hypothetical protein
VWSNSLTDIGRSGLNFSQAQINDICQTGHNTKMTPILPTAHQGQESHEVHAMRHACVMGGIDTTDMFLEDAAGWRR